MIESRTRKNGWQLVAFPVGGLFAGFCCCFILMITITTILTSGTGQRIRGGLAPDSPEGLTLSIVMGATFIGPLIVGVLLFLGGYYLALHNNRPTPNLRVVNEVKRSIESETNTPR